MSKSSTIAGTVFHKRQRLGDPRSRLQHWSATAVNPFNFVGRRQALDRQRHRRTPRRVPFWPGCAVIAFELEHASDAEAGSFDLAVLDVDLERARPSGLLPKLRAKGVPFLLLTGSELERSARASKCSCRSKAIRDRRLIAARTGAGWLRTAWTGKDREGLSGLTSVEPRKPVSSVGKFTCERAASPQGRPVLRWQLRRQSLRAPGSDLHPPARSHGFISRDLCSAQRSASPSMDYQGLQPCRN